MRARTNRKRLAPMLFVASLCILMVVPLPALASEDGVYVEAANTGSSELVVMQVGDASSSEDTLMPLTGLDDDSRAGDSRSMPKTGDAFMAIFFGAAAGAFFAALMLIDAKARQYEEADMQHQHLQGSVSRRWAK